MDYFDPFGGDRPIETGTRFLLVSFDTDWRFPTAQSRVIADRLAWSGVDVEAVEVASPWGHDSFLLPVPEYLALVARRLGGDAGG
jgi:homoserine O-acetyltransferase